LIAVIAGGKPASTGPIGFALEHAGFEIRDAATPDDAALIVKDHGDANCVLTIDARKLSASAGHRTWASFMADHPALSAVVTTHAAADDAALEATRGANRRLLENPFDAAAVVAGVRRAVHEPAPHTGEKMARVRLARDESGRSSATTPHSAGKSRG